MKRAITILTILILVGAARGVEAQEALIRYADDQQQQMNYRIAAEIYTKAFEKKSSYRSARNAAFCYTKNNEYDEAVQWWKEAIAFSDEVSDSDVKFLLEAGHAVGKDKEVRDFLEDQGIPKKHIKEYYSIMEADGEKAVNRLKLLDKINSTAADFMLAKDPYGNKYFVSDRGDSIGEVQVKKLRFDAKDKIYDEKIYEWTGRGYLKIYRQDKEGNIRMINMRGSDFMHVSDPSFVKVEDTDYVFFSVTRDLRKERKNRDFEIQPELYYGTLNEEGSLEYVYPYPRNLPLSYGLITPYADAKSQRLYFASNMEGGHGGYDLYYVNYYKDGDRLIFSAPANLGERINTAENERDPFVHQGKLYFASEGHSSYGELDVFFAEMLEGGVLGAAVNMGPLINSGSDDFAYRRYGDDEIYLSSNRKGKEGLDDIYQFLPAQRRLLAKVMDCKGDTLSDIQFSLKQIDGEAVEVDKRVKGNYWADLSAESQYEVKVEKEGYFPVLDREISSVGMDSGTIRREYRLARIPTRDLAITEIIYYDLDKSLIRRSENEILDDVAELMIQYPQLELHVSSHTDARASHQYNQRLSEDRAKSVVNYLGKKGIDPSRIQPAWFGEEQLAIDCPDGKVCSEDQHQLNRRSELLLHVSVKQWAASLAEYEDYCSLTGSLDELFRKAGADQLRFGLGQSQLDIEQKMALERLRLFLLQNKAVKVQFIGALGKKDFDDRVAMVTDYLHSRGIQKNRLTQERFDTVDALESRKEKATIAGVLGEFRQIIIELK